MTIQSKLYKNLMDNFFYQLNATALIGNDSLRGYASQRLQSVIDHGCYFSALYDDEQVTRSGHDCEAWLRQALQGDAARLLDHVVLFDDPIPESIQGQLHGVEKSIQLLHTIIENFEDTYSLVNLIQCRDGALWCHHFLVGQYVCPVMVERMNAFMSGNDKDEDEMFDRWVSLDHDTVGLRAHAYQFDLLYLLMHRVRGQTIWHYLTDYHTLQITQCFPLSLTTTHTIHRQSYNTIALYHEGDGDTITQLLNQFSSHTVDGLPTESALWAHIADNHATCMTVLNLKTAAMVDKVSRCLSEIPILPAMQFCCDGALSPDTLSVLNWEPYCVIAPYGTLSYTVPKRLQAPTRTLQILLCRSDSAACIIIFHGL